MAERPAPPLKFGDFLPASSSGHHQDDARGRRRNTRGCRKKTNKSNCTQPDPSKTERRSMELEYQNRCVPTKFHNVNRIVSPSPPSEGASKQTVSPKWTNRPAEFDPKTIGEAAGGLLLTKMIFDLPSGTTVKDLQNPKFVTELPPEVAQNILSAMCQLNS